MKKRPSIPITATSLPVFSISVRGCKGDFQGLAGATLRARTRFRIAFAGGMLTIRIEADDPDGALALIASVSKPGTDRYLYEEDCIQVAFNPIPAAAPESVLLINARGTRAGSAPASWRATALPHALGWTAEIAIPVTGSPACVGLSLHRFVRGVGGEIQSLGSNLPHPLVVSSFPCVVLVQRARAQALAAAWRAQALVLELQQEAAQVADVRTRLAKGDAASVPRDWQAQAIRLAEQRFEMPVATSSERFLCWNEAHFQHAVLNLWALTGDRAWLERLIPRIEAVWSLTSEARGVKDALWGETVPTWINDLETGSSCTLVSGAILWPITRWMRIVQGHRRLADLAPVAKAWTDPAVRILTFHDREWVDLPDGGGMHLEPYQKGPQRVYPRGGSRINPLNREFFLALPMLHMARLTGNVEFQRKVESNARYFVRTSDIGRRWFQWEYRVGACPADGEDLAHGACQMAFAVQCHMEGIVITASHLRKMADNLADCVFRFGDVPAGTVRGWYPGLHLAVAAWTRLCRYRPDVLPKIGRVLRAAIAEEHPLFVRREGYAVRLLTEIACAERQLAGKEPLTA